MGHWYNEDSLIHPTAVIHKNAKLGQGTIVGPFSIIGPEVEMGENCEIAASVTIDGHTVMGSRNRIFNGAAIGLEPQDLKYKGESSRVVIGNGNTFREYVTVNRGTEGGGGETRIGDNNLVMAYTHIAHDCRIGNGVLIANSTNMAGHVVIEDNAVLSGATGIVQFVRIGTMAMTGGVSKLSKDLPPYFIADGNPCRIRGINKVGMMRNGLESKTIKIVEKAYKLIYLSGMTLVKAMEIIETDFGELNEIRKLLSFLKSSDKGIVR